MTTGHKLVGEFKEKYNVIDNGKKYELKNSCNAAEKSAAYFCILVYNYFFVVVSIW